MVIIFYNISVPVNTVDKNPKDETDINGVLRDNTSILTPSFTIESEETPQFNYCYIPLFGRYYFITDITRVNNKLVKIDCKVDVLQSFVNDIKQSYAKSKTAVDFNSYYEKLDIGVEVRTTETIIDFPNTPFSETGNIVLVAINGTGVE